jgi:hypothetical protein
LCISRLHKNVTAADNKKQEEGKNKIIFSHYLFSYATKYGPVTIKWLPGNIGAGQIRGVLCLHTKIFM